MTVHFVCADDAHGTPVMLRAEKEGVTPEQFIARMHGEHLRDFDGFRSRASTTITRRTAPENTAPSPSPSMRRLKAGGHDRHPGDRAVLRPGEGHVPRRTATSRASARSAARRTSTETLARCAAPSMRRPTSGTRIPSLSGAAPVRKRSEHYFFRLSDPRCADFLREWMQGTNPDGSRRHAAGGRQQGDGMAGGRAVRTSSPTGTSRATPPISASRSPAIPDKYFYVWLDAPIGYFASFKAYADRKGGIDFDGIHRGRSQREGGNGNVPLHRQGHPLFPYALLAGDAPVFRALKTPTRSPCTGS